MCVVKEESAEVIVGVNWREPRTVGPGRVLYIYGTLHVWP